MNSRLVRGLATTAAGLAAYRFVVQPWHQTWGATRPEVDRRLPGDEFVKDPSYETTRAITIGAPPVEVWPWIVQLGQDRAGFYSYDWLENLFGLDIHNADHIVPEWQELHAGDIVRLGPPDKYDGAARVRVLEIERNRTLVLGPVDETEEDRKMTEHTGGGTWAFLLEPTEEGTTRLIVRTRSHPWKAPRTAFYLYDPAHFIMERKMLLGIKERAESARQVPVREWPEREAEAAKPVAGDAQR